MSQQSKRPAQLIQIGLVAPPRAINRATAIGLRLHLASDADNAYDIVAVGVCKPHASNPLKPLSDDPE